jgi:hypothetical protein
VLGATAIARARITSKKKEEIMEEV